MPHENFIKPVKHPEWLTNMAVVPKKNEKGRICIDICDLNKACQNDSFPLPKIDHFVDATVGHHLLSFMDAYSGCNQIPIYQSDQEATAFVTNINNYCYKVMPFGLKDVGAM